VRQHDGLGFLDGEHERRQIEAGSQPITNAAPALDGDPHSLERGNVSINGSRRHVEASRNMRSRHGLFRRPQDLDDFEEPRRFPHRHSFSTDTTLSGETLRRTRHSVEKEQRMLDRRLE
jgi:hypothetical protein